MKDQNGYNVRAVERALQILESFSEENAERGVSEIAQLVDLHKATTFRIVTTLVNFGFLERTADGQKYRLGMRLASLGSNVIQRMDVRREALPYMQRLVDQWGESVDLSIFEQNDVFFVEAVQGNHALTFAAAVISRLPLHCTASGKVFLAYLPPDKLDRLLQQPLSAYTDKTITSPEKLREQLVEIRRLGYAIDDEELEVGVYAFSAPIRNQHKEVIAAMGMPIPVSRLNLSQLPAIAAALCDTTASVSYRLGYRP
jgi:DNA-binding IclR family transcriptional regulator